QVTREWHRQGIPLRLVELTLAEIFERRRAKDAKDGRRSLVTLRYCRRAVDRSWRRRQELLAPASSGGGAPAFDPESRLAALAAALPEGLPRRRQRQDEILDLAGDAEAIEQELAEIEAGIVAEVLAELDPQTREELDARLQKAVQPLAERLPKAELERARSLLREQLLRRLTGLPVLSLFSPAAETA
ncbi:MAG: hypothetical protein V3T72_11425, partial [Thermoanaerobaculia bacterium]